MNISFFIALLLIFRSCGIFFLIFVGFLNVLLDYEFLVCLFHQCFFNCVWVNVAWQPWQNNFLLFRFDVKWVIFKLAEQLDFLKLCYVVSLNVICNSQAVHRNLCERITNMIDPHQFFQAFISFQFTKISKYIRITIRCKMSKKYDIILIFEFIAECQGICFLEVIFLIVYISGIEFHVESLWACSDSFIVKEIINIKAFPVPLDPVSFHVPPPGVNKWLHTVTVKTLILHQIEHIDFQDSTFLEIETTKIEPLRQWIVRIRIIL